MTLIEQWPQIRSAFESAIRASHHCSIASISADGMPHVTPIGFVFVRDDCTAYYFEEHARGLRANVEQNPNVCIQVVNTSLIVWPSPETVNAASVPTPKPSTASLGGVSVVAGLLARPLGLPRYTYAPRSSAVSKFLELAVAKIKCSEHRGNGARRSDCHLNG